MKRILCLLYCFFVFVCFTGFTETPNKTLSQDDLKHIFDEFGVEGTFLLYDLGKNTLIVYNEERADKGFLPASTFKILNSLIALETGTVKDQCDIIEWDRRIRRFDEWNRNQDLRSAIRNSVVWAYQELARRIGEKQMKVWVDKVKYGNGDISGDIDTFWLEGELRISARQQLEFLIKLYKNELPFSQRNMDIVKEIMIVEQTATYAMRAKTGWVGGLYPQTGWYVGYLETVDNVYFFALNIAINKRKDGDARIGIARKVFQKLNLISK
jgi:beta-lactamase class D